MHWFSVAYFFCVTLTTGALIDLFVKEWQADWLEKLVMRFGVGLAAMSVEGVLFNLLHIPLDYRVFLGFGALVAIAAIARHRPFRALETGRMAAELAQCWRSRRFWYALFVLALFAVTVKMYVGGAFRYDYFENTDPWRYTVVADYIGENRTFTAPYYSIQYTEPYTQGYQIVMGVLSQTNESIYWTMKFFHSLVISFGVLFMYYFARRFSGDEEIALLASLFLFAVPAWVTHFVFSLHYNMTIFVVLLYVLAQLMHERPGMSARPTAPGGMHGWMYVGIVVYASMLVNHFSTVIHGSIFCLVFVATRTLAERRLDWKTIGVFLGGFLLSLLFYVPAYARHWRLTELTEIPGGIGGVERLYPLMRFVSTPPGMFCVALVLAMVAFVYKSRQSWQRPVEKWLDTGHRGMAIWLGGLVMVLVLLLQPIKIVHSLGSDDVAIASYELAAYFAATDQNRYHNPVGLGFVLMSAVVGSFLLATLRIGKLFTPEKAWAAVGYGWIITAFLLVLGKHFSIAIIPFRAWTFLGFFASLFAAGGIVILIRALARSDRVLIAAIALLAATVIPTSFPPKYRLNTSIWGDYKIGTPESRALFAWVRDGGLPKNSVVAHLCGDSEFLTGYDMNPPVWNKVFHPERTQKPPYFVENPLFVTADAYAVLKEAQVEYVTLGASCAYQTEGDQRVSVPPLLPAAVHQLVTDQRFTLIKHTGAEFLFRVN